MAPSNPARLYGKASPAKPDTPTANFNSLLGVHERFQEVIKRVQDDRDFGMNLVNVARLDFFIVPEKLSNAVGMVISSREYPAYLRTSFQRALGLKSRRAPIERDHRWAQSSFKACYCAINRLVRLPASLDRLEFEPFANTRKHARASGGKPDKRTLNLPVDELAKILRTALIWGYDRSDGVLELVKICRDAARTATQRGYSKEHVAKHMNLALQAAYPAISVKYGLPGGTLRCSACRPDRDHVSLVDLVHRLQTAAALLVGINLARRKNEILGEDYRPYGLYRGCLKLSDPFVNAYELDIYIEKTWRDWRAMSTNKLIVDSVRVLERLREIMLPDEVLKNSEAKEVRRARKLFIAPSTSFFLGNGKAPFRYSFETNSASFFEEAGVAEDYRRTHPMRRFFAMTFMYRWDHPALQALSEHLCHLDLETTRIYVTDDAMRAEVERTAKVLRTREDGLPIEELTEAQLLYRDDQLRAMLTSTSTGGPMTYRVRKWVRRLAPKVQFSTPELGAMVEATRSTMEKKKYLPVPFRHGVCWAPEHGTAPRVARCGEGSALHREKAGIRICRSCPFHSTSDAFLMNLDTDARSLEKRAISSSDPEERRCCEASAKSLRELIAFERALMTQQSAPYDVEGKL